MRKNRITEEITAAVEQLTPEQLDEFLKYLKTLNAQDTKK